MTYTEITDMVESLVNDNSTSATTLIQTLINQTQHYLLGFRKDITEKSTTATTVASTQAYNLPYDYGKMFMVTVTVGGVAYPLLPIEDDILWRDINARSSSYTSDIPQFYFIFDDQIFIYPTPTSASNTITMYYHKTVKEMSVADYTTGTITTLANAGTAVTGATTVWTALFIGRFLRITNDGIWYEISARTSNTAITIKKAYQGTAISAGSAAYTIGEMPIIPESYQDLLVWRPAAQYFQQKGMLTESKFYWELFKEMEKQFKSERSYKVESAMISGSMVDIKKSVHLADPNMFPSSLTS